MIIFLYGQDTYRSRQKLGEIIERHKEVHKSGLNLRFFDNKNLNYQDFNDEFRQTPMFQERKLLILKNSFSNQEFKNYFLENGKKFADSKDIIVFYEEGEISANDPLFKFLAKNAKVQEFQALSGPRLRHFAQEEFDKYKAQIQPKALWALVSYTGNDLWRLSNEIQKLSAFKTCLPARFAGASARRAGRENQIIEIKDVDFLVRAEIETDIFKTIEAMASRNKRAALSLIHEHLEKGDNPLYLLSMVCFQFRNLLIIKKTGKLNAHPYVVKKTAALAGGFSLEELEKIYYDIFETDIKIKTGRLDPQLALDLLVTGI